MGKMSIYLPDELEARVKSVQPDAPTSQVIRAALERYLGPDDQPSYAVPPADLDELLAAGIAHFTELALTDYQEGYRAALKRLPDLDWHALADFARAGYDLNKWLGGLSSSMAHAAVEGDHTPAWVPKMADDVGELLNPVSFDRWNFRRTPPWQRGYGEGLRAGYEAALRAGVVSGRTSPEPQPDVEEDSQAHTSD